jgi:hypothetical protein
MKLSRWEQLEPASSQEAEVLGLHSALFVTSNMGTQIFFHQKHNLIFAPHQVKRSTNHLQSVPLPEFGGVPAAARLDGGVQLGCAFGEGEVRGFAEENEG